MDARDLLLDEHGRMHATSVTGDKGTLAERTFGGLTDEQMRARPREDLNSLAWLMWHIARAEDIFSNIILSGRDQVVDDGWLARLKISRRDFGIGMTKPEVTELTAQVDVAALRDYRDAVGRRTQEVIRGFGAGGLAGRAAGQPRSRRRPPWAASAPRARWSRRPSPAARASASWAACSSLTPPCTWARPRPCGRREASAPVSSLSPEV